MPPFEGPPEQFASAWVSGEIGNGPDPITSGEHDPSKPRPTQEELQDQITSLNKWRDTNADQRSYTEWWNKWKNWSEGNARPELGSPMCGWTIEDFRTVFEKIKLPVENTK